jgi:hypothetical protein
MFINLLLKQGQLESWRDGNTLRDRVFQIASVFPLDHGLARADAGASIAALSDTH